VISKEVISKIRHIEIKSKKLVEEVFSGEYRSRFKGKGMAFEDIREYYHGDDVRNIDWNVTARHNKAYIKQFSEEREMNLFLLIDMSASNKFGAKKELIAEIGATLSYSAHKNNDKVGMIMFTDQVEKTIPSLSGKRHVLSIIENILSFEAKGSGTDIGKALKYFTKIEKKRSIVFLISDFMDEGYEKALNMISKEHDLVLLHVLERAEAQIPKWAIFTFKDLENGQVVVLDNLKGDQELKDQISVSYPDVIQVYTDEDYVKLLRLYFSRRGGL